MWHFICFFTAILWDAPNRRDHATWRAVLGSDKAIADKLGVVAFDASTIYEVGHVEHLAGELKEMGWDMPKGGVHGDLSMGARMRRYIEDYLEVK